MINIINNATYVEFASIPVRDRITYAKNQYDPILVSNKIYLVNKAMGHDLVIESRSDINSIDDGGAVAIPATMSGILDLLVTYFYV